MKKSVKKPKLSKIPKYNKGGNVLTPVETTDVPYAKDPINLYGENLYLADLYNKSILTPNSTYVATPKIDMTLKGEKRSEVTPINSILHSQMPIVRKYPNGGFIKKVGEAGLNSLRSMADIPLTTIGLDDVISDDQYTGASSKFAKGYSDVVGGIGKAALPIAANIIAPGSGALVSAGQSTLSSINNDYIAKPEETMYNQGITSNINANPYAEYSYAKGGKTPDTTIEVEGNELEVSNGKILKDFKNKAKHTEGGYTYNAQSGNMIIPSKLRSKYLEGDKITRNTIEANLRKDQVARDRDQQEIVDIFEEGGASYKDGGTIHIKPQNKGKFTAAAKRAGMDVQEYASKVLANKENYSPTLVKRANFAKNATKFNHAMGGVIKKYQGPETGSSVIGVDEANEEMYSPLNPFYHVATGDSFAPLQSKNILNQQRSVPEIDTTKLQSIPKTDALGRTSFNPSNLQKAGYYGSMFAPIAYNLIKGTQKPQVLNPEQFQNPYENEAVSALRSRRIDTTPLLNRIRTSRMNALNNAKVAGNTGAYLSNAAQIEANTAQNMAEAELQAQDYNNRYKADLASGLGQFGSQRASRNLQIQDINDRNRAARNTMLASAAGQTSQAGQGIYGDEMRFNTLDDLYSNYEYDRSTGKWKFKS